MNKSICHACPVTQAVTELLKYAKNVIPSKEGIQKNYKLGIASLWIPAYAGMTFQYDITILQHPPLLDGNNSSFQRYSVEHTNIKD